MAISLPFMKISVRSGKHGIQKFATINNQGGGEFGPSSPLRGQSRPKTA
jgi:hypothetical protein